MGKKNTASQETGLLYEEERTKSIISVTSDDGPRLPFKASEILQWGMRNAPCQYDSRQILENYLQSTKSMTIGIATYMRNDTCNLPITTMRRRQQG